MSLSPNVDEQAYVKQMRNVDPNYLPLYDPNPWSEDYLYLGDVGVIQAGTFRPLFNITMKAAQRRNGGGVPENFETLPFSPPSHTYTRSDPTVIKKFDPCFGDPRLSWSKVTSSEDAVQDTSEASEEDEHHEKANPCFSYELKKNSPETSYVLLAMSDVEETVVGETQMEVWRHYMEKNHKYWLKYIRKKWLDPSFKAENLVLLCGLVKTSSWVIATLPREGVYRLDVRETPVGIRPTLTLGGKPVDEGLRYGQDPPEGHRELMQHFAQLAGLRVPDSREPIRKRCLFIKGLRMEKDFWLPKRIVAAAEPHPKNDGGFGPSSTYIPTSSPRSHRACTHARCSCQYLSETTLTAVRYSQTRKPVQFPRSRPCPWIISLNYNPSHAYCSSPISQSSLPNIQTVVAF